jgi:hypothetical protein
MLCVFQDTTRVKHPASYPVIGNVRDMSGGDTTISGLETGLEKGGVGENRCITETKPYLDHNHRG